jgi:hypothetical protein
MPETRVVNVKHIQPGPAVVYIGRTMGGRWAGLRDLGWGNPYKGAGALDKYERHLRSRPDLLRRLPELRGKQLACWCAPPAGLTLADPPICHGQILLKLLRESEGDGGAAVPAKPRPPLSSLGAALEVVTDV